MESIWKYQLQITGKQVLQMPKGSKVLSVQNQTGIPTIWAIVNPHEPLEERVFEMIGTGHPISNAPNRKYIETFQLMGGELVYHVFEITE